MEKHTIGPWRVQKRALPLTEYGYERYEENIFAVEQHIATVWGPGAGATMESKNANARLIAAAPDMLSALYAVKPMLMYPQGDMETWIRIVDAVNAAIAKAEGVE